MSTSLYCHPVIFLVRLSISETWIETYLSPKHEKESLEPLVGLHPFNSISENVLIVILETSRLQVTLGK